MRLLIDDLKNLDGVDVIARDITTGIKILGSLSITTLYLDHDIGEVEEVVGPLNIDGLSVPRNGQGVLQWLAAFPDKAPLNIVLVTLNPVGRKRMEQLLHDMSYKEDTPGLWVLTE